MAIPLEVLRVGTTFDYKPFSYRDSSTMKPRGLDIVLAERISPAAGVEFIPTSWKSLSDDLRAGTFDIGMSGISFTPTRASEFLLSKPYLSSGKCLLVRKTDAPRFSSLTEGSSVDSIDKPELRIGVNPGGTNEAFVRKHFSRAQVTVFPDNLVIPRMVSTSVVDVMITDSIEAILMAKIDSSLLALTESLLTKDVFVFMARKGREDLIARANALIEELMSDDTFTRLVDTAINETALTTL